MKPGFMRPPSRTEVSARLWMKKMRARMKEQHGGGSSLGKVPYVTGATRPLPRVVASRASVRRFFR